MKRREICSNAMSKKVELHGLILGGFFELGYTEEEEEVSAEKENQWIINPFLKRLQVSLSTISSDRRLLLWRPENTLDEVKYEPAQLLMIAADHEDLFPGGVKPWIPLPREINSRKRDLSIFSNCFKSCIQNHGECREISFNLGLDIGPSRLIDIEEMRIVTIGIDETPRYLVLSYVWGGEIHHFFS